MPLRRAREKSDFVKLFDPIETGVRGRIRGLIEELVAQEVHGRFSMARGQRCCNSVSNLA